MELAKYNIDIAVLNETRFHASGSLNDLEYTFYWSGKPNGERREAGVGFAIKRDIVAKLTELPHPVNDRIITMRIPLTKDRNATIVSAYAPTMTNPEENKETFYSQLKGTLRNIPSTDKLLLIGDFNARIGRENDKWPSASPPIRMQDQYMIKFASFNFNIYKPFYFSIIQLGTISIKCCFRSLSSKSP